MRDMGMDMAGMDMGGSDGVIDLSQPANAAWTAIRCRCAIPSVAPAGADGAGRGLAFAHAGGSAGRPADRAWRMSSIAC
jgi:hypothetical protein